MPVSYQHMSDHLHPGRIPSYSNIPDVAPLIYKCLNSSHRQSRHRGLGLNKRKYNDTQYNGTVFVMSMNTIWTYMQYRKLFFMCMDALRMRLWNVIRFNNYIFCQYYCTTYDSASRRAIYHSSLDCPVSKLPHCPQSHVLLWWLFKRIQVLVY